MPNKIDIALSCFQSGDHGKALNLLENILSNSPKHAFAWFLSAVIHIQKGKIDTAIQAFKSAIKHQPIYPEAFNNLGVALESKNNDKEALIAYKKAIKQKKGYSSAHYNLANIQKQNNDFDNAIENYTLAIKYKPDYTNALNNLALIHQYHLNYKTSESLLLKAVALEENDLEIRNNLGHNYYCLFQYNKANDIFQSILSVDPYYEPTLLNIGLLMGAIGKLNIARQYLSSLPVDGRLYAQAMNNLAHLELSVGNLKVGWDYYRFRPSTRNPIFNALDQIPNDSNGKKVLVYKDQGIGDEIFFARFIPLLDKYHITLSYYTDEKLSPLWERAFKHINIIKSPPQITSYDFVLSLAELPRLLFSDEAEIVPPSIKITPQPSIVDNINCLLPNNGKRNIAVTWEAGAIGKDTLFKRLPPRILGQKLSHEDANIIIVQRKPSTKDIKTFEKALGRKSFNFSFLNNNLDEMLALLSIVDDYHCVSNTNTHLIATLNKPCHVYIPYPPEWRWTNEGNQSPWFPQNILHRQISDGTWPDE